MRFQDASLMLKPRNLCPVCGAETALAEIEPHPLHANFEIHGYLCDRCGPIKSLVVLRSPPLAPTTGPKRPGVAIPSRATCGNRTVWGEVICDAARPLPGKFAPATTPSRQASTLISQPPAYALRSTPYIFVGKWQFAPELPKKTTIYRSFRSLQWMDAQKHR
jgi:hypothetical protein